MEKPVVATSLVAAKSSPRNVMEFNRTFGHPGEGYSRAETALLNSPVTAKQAIYSPEQKRRVMPPNIVSSILRVLIILIRKGQGRMGLR